MLKPFRTYVLSVGGFDPTAGAGVLADIKTAERLGCYGMSVLTANTVQEAEKVHQVNWLSLEYIESQLSALEKYPFKAIKIGIVENIAMLQFIVEQVKKKWPEATVIWDPVLKASDNTNFFKLASDSGLNNILPLIDIITPNKLEFRILSGLISKENSLEKLSTITSIYLTGGHNDSGIGVDFFADKGTVKRYNPKPGAFSEKHGSGCILSMALACHLAKGYSIHVSILKSKRYIERALKSNKSLLAYHY